MKTKVQILLVLIQMTFIATGAERLNTLPLARLTVEAVDEQHVPIQGATVSFTFMDPTTWKGVPISGLTDLSGDFSGEGGSDSSIGCRVHKAGYYSGGFAFEPFRDIKDGHWQPWDSTYIAVLRKIGNPVPVYARTFRELTIPEIQKPCGFDLEIADWIAPYGKGKVSDFIVTARREYESRDKFKVSAVIRFSNPLDGVQAVKLPEEWRFCEFKWPRTAPETGYQPTLSADFGTEPGKGFSNTASENQAYFFRVRTIEENGRIMSALYGKIDGGINLEGRETKTCTMAFTYYLNPTPLDRNMEFDLKRNQFTALTFLEQPRRP